MNDYQTVNGQVSKATLGPGVNVYRAISAASNNAAVIKSTAGVVYGISINNVNAAARYLKLYNKATTPAPASDAALLKMVIPLAPSGAVVNIEFSAGVAFSTGIGVALVTGISDTDNTSVAASEHAINVLYQ